VGHIFLKDFGLKLMYGSILYYCLFVVLAYNICKIYPRLIIFFILFFFQIYAQHSIY